MYERVEDRLIKRGQRTSTAMRTALRLAEFFSKVPNCRDVFLFGSTARMGFGRDVDLIVTVPEEIFEVFKGIARSICKDDGYYSTRYVRYNAMRKALFGTLASDCPFGKELLGAVFGISLEDLNKMGFGQVRMLTDAMTPLDIFLFPQDWAGKLEELQSYFPNSDPKFMKNVHQDARWYDPILKNFVTKNG